MLPLRVLFVGIASVSALAFVFSCGDDDPSAASDTPDGAASSSGSSGGSSGASGSSSGSSGSSGDATVDAGPRCDPSKPFGTPMMLLENSFLIDQSARLSPDELTLYYAGYGQPGVNGQTELWVATRASSDVPFKNPTKIAELSTSESELYPTVTADGLTIYYDGQLDGGYGIMKASRASVTSAWGAPTLIAGTGLTMPYVSPDGKRLYGSKNAPGPSSNSDIHYIDLPWDGGASTVVPGTASAGLQYWPVISADGLTLFYSYPMLSPYRWELGVAKRASTNDPFGPTQKVVELDTDSGADENPTWVSPDGCRLYFRRGNADIPGNASGLLQATRGL